jgi:hypothetical protein
VNNKQGVSIVDGTRSKIVYELKEGLQAFSNKRVCVSKLIEFKQSAGVNELTKLIGCFAVFGIRQRRPKLADRMRKLEIYDGVHYLLEEDDRVSASLEYAKGLRQLTLMVSYRHYLANWKAGVAQNVPTHLLKKAIEYNLQNNNTGHKNESNISDNNINNNKHLLGASFEYLGELTKVVKLCDDGITFECTVVTTRKSLNLDGALVGTLLTEYLN